MITVLAIETQSASTWYIDYDKNTKKYHLAKDEYSKGVYNSLEDALEVVLLKINTTTLYAYKTAL